MKSQAACALMANNAGKRQMRRHYALTNHRADQYADDLRDNSTWAKEGREEGEGTDQRQRNQADGAFRQRFEAVRNPVTEAGSDDDTDQRRNEGHKGQDGFQHRIDGVASRLEENGDDRTHADTDTRQKAV